MVHGFMFTVYGLGFIVYGPEITVQFDCIGFTIELRF
jgi:hypothetical protein